ncbi:MAG: hypothetical protein E3K40_11590 [Candidatus Brocadia sp.]|nr:Ig-like domain-containing protein [Candidatus Brocadia sp.]MDG6027327.1 hypothetical protein [Candidatus Brocadia sp.]
MQRYPTRKILFIIFSLVFLKFGFFVATVFADWTTNIIDSTGYVGRYTSVAFETSGAVHISYYDTTNKDLKYATNVSGSWITSTLDSNGNVGLYTSIAVDTSDAIHISYYDATSDDLKYATNVSGSWVTSTLDSNGNVGLYTSIAVDTSDVVHISYYDTTNDNLKYVTNASGTWVKTVLDSNGDVGMHTSIAVDSEHAVHISYYDYSDGHLKYATNTSGAWMTNTLDQGEDVGRYSSIAVDTSGVIHISYYDYDNGHLKYVTNASGEWVANTIDQNEDVGRYSSIAVGASGTVHICYYDYNNGYLKYATNVSGSWVLSTLDSNEDVGRYASVAVDISNAIGISYYDATEDDLKYIAQVDSVNSGGSDGTDDSNNTDGSDSSNNGSAQAVLKVTSTKPSSKTQNVSINTTVSATFSMYVNGSTVTTETFKLKSKDGEINGIVNTNGKIVTFTPSIPLAYNTTYTATLTQKIQAANYAGTTMTSNYVWSFITESDNDNSDGSLSINNGATFTNSTTITLNLSATDHGGITGYFISDRSDTPQTSDSDWVSVVSTTSFTADIQHIVSSDEGNKTIYAFYKDASGNISNISGASITFDPDFIPSDLSVVKQKNRVKKTRKERKAAFMHTSANCSE